MVSVLKRGGFPEREQEERRGRGKRRRQCSGVSLMTLSDTTTRSYQGLVETEEREIGRDRE